MSGIGDAVRHHRAMVWTTIAVFSFVIATSWWLYVRLGNPANLLLSSRYYDPLEIIDSLLPLLGIVIASAGVYLAFRQRIQDDTKRQQTLADHTLTPVQIITRVLEDRISQLSRASTAIYWTILTILLGGLILVVFSGYLSSFDSVSSNLFARLDNQQSKIENSFASSFIDSLRGETPEGKAALIAAINRRTTALTQIDRQRDAVVLAVLDGMKNRELGGSGINVGGTVLRVCIIGLIIFLVQILVQLYRYNSRLIAFYSSRRDALLLSNGETQKLETLTQLFAPVGLDFGRTPAHPLQEIGSFFEGRRDSKESKGSASGP